jgi:hypothetical protein
MKYKSLQSLSEPTIRQNELRALLLIALEIDNNTRNYQHSSAYHTHWGAMLDEVEQPPPEYHPTYLKYEKTAFDDIPHIYAGDGPIEQYIYALVEEIFCESKHLNKISGISPSIHINASIENQVFIYIEDEVYDSKTRDTDGFCIRLNHRDNRVVEHGIVEDMDD